MLRINIDEMQGIVILEPDGQLSESDFTSAAKIIDPYIDNDGKLQGIIVHAKSFPGWDCFSAMLAHLSFIKNHHNTVSRLAFATDSPVAGFAERVAPYFVNAKVKHFLYSEITLARKWIIAHDEYG